MTTLVGMQNNFADALRDLIELEYAAREAYKVAFDKLENKTYKDKIGEFMADHERHIKELGDVLRSKNEDVPDKSDAAKQFITKGKVILANLVGDRAILMAMRSNEIDTNTAYERMIIHENIWPETADLIKRNLNDERKHQNWLEQTIS